MINEKILKEKEKKAIFIKAQYIETHSQAILEQFENDSLFKMQFLNFLVSDDIINSSFELKENEKDYCSSLAVIFSLCSSLPDMGIDQEESKGLRNKLRIYTKRFYIVDDQDLKKSNQFVDYNLKEYKRVKKLVKEHYKTPKK
jgi:hypothetical protein